MAKPLLMLALSPTMQQGLIAKWLVSEGDTIKSGDVIMAVETDKATMEYESPQSGTLLKIVAAAGSRASVGQLVGIIGTAGEDLTAVLKEATTPAAPVAATTSAPVLAKAKNPTPLKRPNLIFSNRKPASPLARKLARDAGLNLLAVQGSGPNGRIVKHDVEVAMLQASGRKLQPTLDLTTLPKGHTLPLSEKRRITAERLSQSMYTAPHYYLTMAVEIDNLLATRAKLNQDRTDKLSLNAFILKVVADALTEHPTINRTWANDQLYQFDTIDIAFAVALEDGLITPVVRDAGSKSIAQIDQDIRTLVEKSRNKTITLPEFTNSTFTISNLGSFDIEEFTAIINPPGSAILAIGKATPTPVVDKDNQIIIRQLLKLTLSCDHRVIDGAVGAAFLKALKNLLEYPQ